ncbi:hypothetical protein NKR19_g9363 [Coniochaeta hoffmannii]|uniref:Uncharacterized protein n=1 Tax=Coniochaeta hoffmannii TaxID=91930 RepID=A0AA38RAI5_9PEZI|nr:hypothetical protein NKR19_g9363 [Coniochaeta hoffmannii]
MEDDKAMADDKSAAHRPALEDDAFPPEKDEELPAYSPPSKNPLSAHIPLAQQLQVAAAGPSAGVNRQFPPEFNLYSPGVLTRGFHLGVHKDAPIYVVTTHSGWSGNPDVVLHTTTDPKSPPLATADFKAFSHDTTIVLPPLGAASPAAPTMMKGTFLMRTFNFSVEVSAPGGQLRSEPFEWRHSRGDEVHTLGSVWGRGWKLVRLAGPAPGTKEVVAAFTSGPLSWTKRFCFRFVGAGETGVLGERWAVMAVISAMAIWEKERRASSNND